MPGNTKEQLTDWSAKEREIDIAWMNENLQILAPFAQDEHDKWGRGLVFVNIDKILDEANRSYGYLTQSELEEFENKEILRLVEEYDPKTEMVVSLVKHKGQESVYRVPINSQGDQG